MRKELNSQRIFLVHQHGRRFIVLEHQYGRRDVMWKRFVDEEVWLTGNTLILAPAVLDLARRPVLSLLGAAGKRPRTKALELKTNRQQRNGSVYLEY